MTEGTIPPIGNGTSPINPQESGTLGGGSSPNGGDLTTDEAIDFLTRLRPRGPWYVCLGDPNKERNELSAFVTRECHSVKAMRDLIARERLRRNLYYPVNYWCAGLTTKAKKTDVTWIAGPHADLDPNDHEPPELAKMRYHTALTAFATQYGLPPTYVIDSGNGIQALWQLETPVGREYEHRIEGISRAIMILLGATDRSTFNIDRVLRIPGTINHPDSTKRAKGRPVSQTRLLYVGPAVYGFQHFEPMLSVARAHVAQKPKDPDDINKMPPAEGILRKIGLSDQEVLDRAHAYESITFLRLYNGEDDERNQPGEWSDSFFSLLCSLDYITGDPDQVARIIQGSRFVTDSPPGADDKTRSEKAERTLARTLNRARGVNTPKLEEAAVNRERAEKVWAEAQAKAQARVDAIAGRLSAHASELLKAFPIRKEYLELCYPPGYMAEFVKATEKAMRHPFLKYALPGTLAVFGGLLGRLYKQWDGDSISLMIFLVAPTTTGKTQVMRAWRKFLDRAVPIAQKQQPGHAIHSPLIEASTSSIQGIYEDFAHCPNSAWFIEEATAQIKQLIHPETPIAEQFRDGILALYEAGTINGKFSLPRSVANRKRDYKDIHNLPVAFFWTLPTSQFDVFTQDAMNGVLSRILCIRHDGEAGHLVPEATVVRELPPREHDALVLLLKLTAKTNFAYTTIYKLEGEKRDKDDQIDFERLAGVEETLVRIDYSLVSSINEDMAQCAEEIKRRALRKEIPEGYVLVGRLVPNAKRIAGILAVLDDVNKPTVTLDHYEWAFGYCLQTVVDLLSDLDKGELGEKASDSYLTVKRAVRELMKSTIHKDGIPKTVLRDKILSRKPFANDPHKERAVTHTFEQMQKDGLIVIRQPPSTGGRGRPPHLVLPTEDPFWND